jgi:cytochrome c-type biogenesis protein
MIDSPSIALAFAAGLVSFVSPCCLPLVPGYLATVSGIDVQQIGRRVDARVLGRSLLFVATFSTVFILLGLAATTVGFSAATRSFCFLKRHWSAVQAGSGVALIAMGVLVFTGELFRLNIAAQQFPESLGLNFFQDV